MLSRIQSFAAGVPIQRSPFLRSRSSRVSWKPRQGCRPEECVSRWRSVTRSFSRSPKWGSHFATGSSSPSAPCSTSSITALVVASTFVSDARSNTVSRAIGMRSGRAAASPRTETCSSHSPSRCMRASTTAPGISAPSIARSSARSTLPSLRRIVACLT